jgi:hypothetical protein
MNRGPFLSHFEQQQKEHENTLRANAAILENAGKKSTQFLNYYNRTAAIRERNERAQQARIKALEERHAANPISSQPVVSPRTNTVRQNAANNSGMSMGKIANGIKKCVGVLCRRKQKQNGGRRTRRAKSRRARRS